MRELLTQFIDIFEELTRLPIERGIEHRIVQKSGSPPKYQPPYKYFHSAKEEIKKIIEELLGNGIIQPSKSPFAAPIILVKKKDTT